MLLQMMGKTSEKDIVFIARVFDSLDVHGCGEISEEQLNAAMLQAKERERIRLIEEQKELEQKGLGLGLDNLAIGALGDITSGLGTLGSAVGSGLGNISSGLGLGNLTMGFLGKKDTDSSPLSNEVDNPIHSQRTSYKDSTKRNVGKSSTSSSRNISPITVGSPNIENNLKNNARIDTTPATLKTGYSSNNNVASDLMDVDLSGESIHTNDNKVNSTFKRPHGYSAIDRLGSDLLDFSIDSEDFGDDVLESPITDTTRTPRSVKRDNLKGGRNLNI